MGLETVELVMDVEDAFDISIPNEMAQRIQTVGQLHDAVVTLLRANDNRDWLSRTDFENQVWHQLCELTAQVATDVKTSQITRDTRFIQDLGFG